jgi:intracellular multiplication protein IcmP
MRVAGQIASSILGPVRAESLGQRFGWKVSQVFDVPSFVRELSLTFPQVLPVADGPPGETEALSEVLFSIRYSILLGKDGERPDPEKPSSGPFRFDRRAAREAFAAQLGKPFADEPGKRLSDCPFYVWGIAAVCLARCAGPSGKEDSEVLIDTLSRFFGTVQSNKREKKEKERIARMIAKYERNGEAIRSMRNHGFVNTAIPALFSAAKKYGQLTTGDFVWLKSVDRTLFYALNQVGRKVAFVEAAGCRSHADAEEAEGEPLFEPNVEQAVSALERRLMKLGHLSTGGKK